MNIKILILMMFIIAVIAGCSGNNVTGGTVNNVQNAENCVAPGDSCPEGFENQGEEGLCEPVKDENEDGTCDLPFDI